MIPAVGTLVELKNFLHGKKFYVDTINCEYINEYHQMGPGGPKACTHHGVRAMVRFFITEGYAKGEYRYVILSHLKRYTPSDILKELGQSQGQNKPDTLTKLELEIKALSGKEE